MKLVHHVVLIAAAAGACAAEAACGAPIASNDCKCRSSWMFNDVEHNGCSITPGHTAAWCYVDKECDGAQQSYKGHRWFFIDCQQCDANGKLYPEGYFATKSTTKRTRTPTTAKTDAIYATSTTDAPAFTEEDPKSTTLTGETMPASSARAPSTSTTLTSETMPASSARAPSTTSATAATSGSTAGVKKGKGGIVAAVVVVFLLLFGGAGVYYFFFLRRSAGPSKYNGDNGPAAPPPAAVAQNTYNHPAGGHVYQSPAFTADANRRRPSIVVDEVIEC